MLELLAGLLMLSLLLATQTQRIWALWAASLCMATAVVLAMLGDHLAPQGLGLLAALLAIAFWLNDRPSQPWAWLLLLLLAAAALLHVWPGIRNPIWIAEQTLGQSPQPYRQFLNLDKAWLGFALLIAWRHVQPWQSQQRRELLWAILIALGVLLLASAGPWLRMDIAGEKLSLFARWASVNLILTCLVEETLFRHGIQRHLGEWWQRRHPHGQTFALLAAAGVFGLAHAGGGIALVLMASLAGLAYGLAYRRHGLWGATLLHFGLNSTHFLLLTYPI